MTESCKIERFESAIGPLVKIDTSASISDLGLKFGSHFWDSINVNFVGENNCLNCDSGVISTEFNCVLNQMVEYLLIKPVVRAEGLSDFTER